MPDGLYRFDEGGKGASKRSSSELVSSRLSPKVRNGLAILEHVLAEVTDPWLETTRKHISIYEGAVLVTLPLATGEAGEELLSAFLSGASWNARGCICRDEGQGARPQGSTWTESEVKASLRSLIAVIVRAYDGEGWLVWEPAPTSALHV